MAKADKGATMSRLHSAARLARTSLAAKLLTHGFYAGQDQIMLALDREDGQTPGQLAGRLGVRPPTITKTINRLQAQGFLVVLNRRRHLVLLRERVGQIEVRLSIIGL